MTVALATPVIALCPKSATKALLAKSLSIPFGIFRILIIYFSITCDIIILATSLVIINCQYN